MKRFLRLRRLFWKLVTLVFPVCPVCDGFGHIHSVDPKNNRTLTETCWRCRGRRWISRFHE